MQECIKCLYKANHPFGITFNKKGICSGCIIHEEKFHLNWKKIFNKLSKRVAKYKKKIGYDCIIPIRGTPEYFYVVNIVKNELGLNPLLVSYNHHFNSSAGINNLDLIRENFDADIYIHTKNPIIYKKIIRETLFSNLNIHWPFLAGETSFCVKLAIEKKIPLIIWPYNQQTEQVGSHSYVDEVEMTNRGRYEYDLAGVNPKDIVKTSNLINEKDVNELVYPTSYEIYKNKIIGIYLSNFLPWDTRKFSEMAVKNFNAKCCKNFRTFDTYDRIDNQIYMSVHDILKFKKFQYSRVTDNLCREIRFKRITKKNAKLLEKFYQSEKPKDAINYFFKWLGANDKTWDWFEDYFKIKYPKKPILNIECKKFIDSFVTNNQSLERENKYILIGKGIYI
tara:strand:+ start:1478 stop:2656 length:1179 start_codon:yes stop_codon:yes gene_type:complete